MFASVGQASARISASLTWSLFTSLLTHRLVLLCVDAYWFIFWDLPGDVLAAPGAVPALCGWMGVILLSLSRNTLASALTADVTGREACTSCILLFFYSLSCGCLHCRVFGEV